MPEIRRLDTSDPGFASALAKLTAHDKAGDDAIDARSPASSPTSASAAMPRCSNTRRCSTGSGDVRCRAGIAAAELKAAHDTLPADQKLALAQAAERIRAYHSRQSAESWSFTEPDGTRLGLRVTPLGESASMFPGQGRVSVFGADERCRPRSPASVRS
jgi:histidinol dehydrogenase